MGSFKRFARREEAEAFAETNLVEIKYESVKKAEGKVVHQGDVEAEQTDIIPLFKMTDNKQLKWTAGGNDDPGSGPKIKAKRPPHEGKRGHEFFHPYSPTQGLQVENRLRAVLKPIEEPETDVPMVASSSKDVLPRVKSSSKPAVKLEELSVMRPHIESLTEQLPGETPLLSFDPGTRTVGALTATRADGVVRKEYEYKLKENERKTVADVSATYFQIAGSQLHASDNYAKEKEERHKNKSFTYRLLKLVENSAFLSLPIPFRNEATLMKPFPQPLPTSRTKRSKRSSPSSTPSSASGRSTQPVMPSSFRSRSVKTRSSRRPPPSSAVTSSRRSRIRRPGTTRRRYCSSTVAAQTSSEGRVRTVRQSSRSTSSRGCRAVPSSRSWSWSSTSS